MRGDSPAAQPHRARDRRYDKLAESFLGMLHLAAIKLWLKFVHGA